MVKKAICLFPGHGYAFLEQLRSGVRITLALDNLPSGLHGFHVHRCGDLSQGCASLCDHYNPDGMQHGGRDDSIHHAGDLGNIYVNRNGACDDSFITYNFVLSEIVGRSLVIHEKEDDLGRGGNAESLKTGNAGARITCGLIGILQD